MKVFALCVVAACGSSTPTPTPLPVEPVVIAPVDAAPPAEPQPPAGLVEAPIWAFRYATAERTEQWTLRIFEGQAMVVVDNAQGSRTYLGTATDTEKSVAIDVSSKTGKVALDCKKTTRKLSAKCNDTKAKAADVLDCYVPDFTEPMPFARGPGVEYVVDKTCTGYRLVR